MKRYRIGLTSMQWAVIALDLSRLPHKEESTQALNSLIRIALEHLENPEDVDLPYNLSVEG